MELLFRHTPVMPDEVLKALEPDGKDGIFCDLTIGGGGHARMIASRLAKEALLIGTDRDPAAIEAATKALEDAPCRVELIRAHFGDIGGILAEHDWRLQGALWDLGLSGNQLERGGGFSFSDLEQPLDMRQDPEQQTTAATLLNASPENDLRHIIFESGNERWAARIARSIIRRRPMSCVKDLVDAALVALPNGWRAKDDVLRKLFQSVRMAVNEELPQLERSLEAVWERTEAEGRLVAISFHSGEDRIVKQFMRQKAQEGTGRLLFRKPLTPTELEIRANSRAHSAKLRAIEKI